MLVGNGYDFSGGVAEADDFTASNPKKISPLLAAWQMA